MWPRDALERFTKNVLGLLPTAQPQVLRFWARWSVVLVADYLWRAAGAIPGAVRLATFPLHSTRQSCVFFSAQGFFRTPFRVQRALFLRAVRPTADTDFTCWRAVSWIYFPPTTDSANVTLMVFVGGVMERLFVAFFLCLDLN